MTETASNGSIYQLKINKMRTNATQDELRQALAIVNKKYYGNISFFQIFNVSKNRVSFRLKAIAGLNGSRTSPSGKNLPFASWHVHGEFYDALFSIRDSITVYSCGKKITKDAGNWEDRNIGSNYQPMYFSEATIEQDDFEFFRDKLIEQVRKLSSKRTRNFERVHELLKTFAASIERIVSYTGQELSFADMVIVTSINKGDLNQLKVAV